jgi:hypothetical protein
MLRMRRAAGIPHPSAGKTVPPDVIAKRIATRQANDERKRAMGIPTSTDGMLNARRTNAERRRIGGEHDHPAP